ncbi:pyridoxal-phosphate dependent enzyme [Candidatus Aerophobetes bacterium]|nr:pyridoxal-phosphate dependent enzyme [Candidatus Aerophobetes bacterium]
MHELYQQPKLVPDWIVVPVGAGPLLAGIYKGYKELKQLGLVDRLPAMVAVQARGCAPIVRAFDKGYLRRRRHCCLSYNRLRI